MVTVRETNKIVNDAKGFVGGMSPYDNPNVRWLKTTSANIHPGMGLIRATGAAGEASCTEHGNDSPMVYAIAEFDPKQIADCSVTYASGDLIPVLPLHLNIGLEMRNILFTDPTGVIEVDSPLFAEAAGSWGIAVESILENSTTDTTEAFAAASVTGANATAGNTVHNRVYLRVMRYWADADVEATIEARIVAC